MYITNTEELIIVVRTEPNEKKEKEKETVQLAVVQSISSNNILDVKKFRIIKIPGLNVGGHFSQYKLVLS